MTRAITLDQVRTMFRDRGARRLLVKFLSPNDNSKNQIYLGGDLGVVNIIPAGEPVAGTSSSHAEPIFKAPVALSWLDGDGVAHPAPHAQLILYPQYPEVRLSGFLRGARTAPTELLTVRDEGRVLLLGITNDRSVIGYAAAGDSALARELRSLRLDETMGVFRVVPLTETAIGDSRDRLLNELCRIHRTGWIPGWALKADGSREPCIASKCVGTTLESELGIVSNARPDPDFEGWEVKGHTVKKLDRPSTAAITLMTPEPTGGVYKREGVISFVRRFGYADTRGRADRLNFGGIHRVGIECKRTQLTLVMDGYDPESQTLVKSDGSLALLTHRESVAASWQFTDLLAHWQKKHSRAAFVPALSRKTPGREYRYGTSVLLAVGTDYLRFLDALARGVVYYDPGIKVEGNTKEPKTKRRSQFRTKARDLAQLYHHTERTDTCQGKRASTSGGSPAGLASIA